MASIGDAWVDGAWVQASWTSGAWATAASTDDDSVRFRDALNRRRMGGMLRVIIFFVLLGL